ncbi:TRAP transporter large permease subunit [Marinovum sp. 2_MG-2023]|uniref:TRAP transporter large permease n=1 Tax=Roseobacteraceae TaxID=2854170 RepID=UPI001FD105F3|nr:MULTISPECIES: TRAP transporter large permease subunit [Roseobacteraceae]MCJ7872796.1 TRAP transporter large permease subunit [Phaeobacter sp. J2-8]MDO6730018.1 TRAP transporter large permease subunit [Marinovum sp. 2_MG-2023]MDO6779832.1 TRAP transporter large permease subunit [Marinovum sp. 1_MG-2023]
MTAVVLVGLFFGLILVGAPIAVALGGSAVLASMIFSPIADGIVGQKLFSNLNHFTLMAIPFFFLAAGLMERGGLVQRLVGLAQAVVGHLRAGLGMTTVLTCIFFAAISGSSPATVAAVGNILYPSLMKEGYSAKYAVGALATSGSIGILIPPSIPLILYGFVTETSIPALFVAGILPGLFYGAMLLITARILAVREGIEVKPKATARELGQALKVSLPALSLPVFIVVGIYGFPEFDLFGWHMDGGAIFTPTEAAAISAVLAMVIGFFIYRELTFRDLVAVTAETGPKVGMVFWITANALLFGFFLTKIGIPAAMAQLVVDLNLSPIVFLLCVNILLVIIGFFLEGVPTILIFAPLLVPAAEALGIDPVHFAIIMVVNIELGLITPPVGINLFVASSITGMPVLKVFQATLPWMAATIITLLFVTYFPPLSMFLPDLMH